MVSYLQRLGKTHWYPTRTSAPSWRTREQPGSLRQAPNAQQWVRRATQPRRAQGAGTSRRADGEHGLQTFWWSWWELNGVLKRHEFQKFRQVESVPILWRLRVTRTTCRSILGHAFARTLENSIYSRQNAQNHHGIASTWYTTTKGYLNHLLLDLVQVRNGLVSKAEMRLNKLRRRQRQPLRKGNILEHVCEV